MFHAKGLREESGFTQNVFVMNLFTQNVFVRICFEQKDFARNHVSCKKRS